MTEKNISELSEILKRFKFYSFAIEDRLRDLDHAVGMAQTQHQAMVEDIEQKALAYGHDLKDLKLWPAPENEG